MQSMQRLSGFSQTWLSVKRNVDPKKDSALVISTFLGRADPVAVGIGKWGMHLQFDFNGAGSEKTPDPPSGPHHAADSSPGLDGLTSRRRRFRSTAHRAR